MVKVDGVDFDRAITIPYDPEQKRLYKARHRSSIYHEHRPLLVAAISSRQYQPPPQAPSSLRTSPVAEIDVTDCESTDYTCQAGGLGDPRHHHSAHGKRGAIPQGAPIFSMTCGKGCLGVR